MENREMMIERKTSSQNSDHEEENVLLTSSQTSGYEEDNTFLSDSQSSDHGEENASLSDSQSSDHGEENTPLTDSQSSDHEEENAPLISSLLRKGERLDDLQREGFYLIQNPSRFCFGMDAVLLGAFALTRQGEQVLDLCSGNGIVPMLLCARNRTIHVTGLEIDKYAVDMARRSALYNGLTERTAFIQGDIREARDFISPASFHAITVNPPYMRGGSGLLNPSNVLAAARHEILCNLDDVTAAAAYALKSSGRLYMVHRPGRLAEIIQSMSRHHLEIKRMQLVYPYIDKESNMVLLEARKGGNPGMIVEKPLIVYQAPGVYTPEVLELYYG